MTTVDKLIEDFAQFEDWRERYTYLLEKGDEIPDFPDEDRVDENLVQGCQSRVWMTAEVDDTPERRLHLRADSEAELVRGLIGVLLELYDGQPVSEIPKIPIESTFEAIGFKQKISPLRSNGFFSMVRRIRELAEAAN